MAGNYTLTGGIVRAPEKVVLYGPEGIGKTTFAAQFPDPVFIDTEGGSGKVNVRRFPKPTTWAMLLDEVDAVRAGHISCGTLVIDTADWADRLCMSAVCAAHKWDSIEAPGYGKGYTYTREEFGKLLDMLSDVCSAGHHVLLTAHAQISKFELPDEMGQYDRWSMKTSKQVAPLLREWCDMLLFANYKTFVVKDGDGKNAHSKAQGGTRVMYTAHHPCWDAKNRDGLPEECPFDFAVLAPVLWTPSADTAPHIAPAAKRTTPRAIDDASSPAPVPDSAVAAPAPLAPGTVKTPDDQLRALGIPDKLRALMSAEGVSDAQLRQAVAMRGYFPEDMPVKDYPDDFVDGCLCAAWPQLVEYIRMKCDIPF